MRIFSSEEYCLRVTRRMFLTSRSDDDSRVPDWRIFYNLSLKTVYLFIRVCLYRICWMFDGRCDMVKSDRIDNDVLREAGLALMRENGKPLTKRPSPGRSMHYTMPSGESVRVRTRVRTH